jgi:hypothetical protein
MDIGNMAFRAFCMRWTYLSRFSEIFVEFHDEVLLEAICVS